MKLSRRRFLLAATAAAALGRVAPGRWEWHGSALGAEARIVLDGPREDAEAAIAAVTAEIGRLEAIFSLHRADSQLSRLNAAGILESPARDLREALAAAERWKRRTEGAFDPAVQPLWSHWTKQRATGGDGDPADALARVRAARVTLAPGHVGLSPGTALTLNGIAQGTVADRAAAVLAAHGFAPPLIDAGEMRLPGLRQVDGGGCHQRPGRVPLRRGRPAPPVRPADRREPRLVAERHGRRPDGRGGGRALHRLCGVAARDGGRHRGGAGRRGGDRDGPQRKGAAVRPAAGHGRARAGVRPARHLISVNAGPSAGCDARVEIDRES